MSNKKVINFTIFLLIASLFLINFVSAQALFCAEKTSDGILCQEVPENEVNKDYRWTPSSCEETDFCQIGVCRNENSGTCTENTPKAFCESPEVGGVWSVEDRDDISECKPGCCILGQEVAFVNEIACRNLGTDYGVDFEFRRDIRTQPSCFALDTTEEEGACVFEITEGTKCERTALGRCAELKGTFYSELLCTASVDGEYISDCAKDSTETMIYRDKVYFVDTCENRANVYDKDKFGEGDYWTYIQEPTCIVGDSTPSSTCGDCIYRLGTIAAEYKAGRNGMPAQRPQYGKNVCKSIGCEYKEVNYKHGESWCAETPGTFSGVSLNISEERTIGGETKSVKEWLKEGYNQYNLPGSEYVKLSCFDGEVIPEKCGDFARNSICMQGEDPLTEKKQAVCFPNLAATCFENINKESCEEDTFCKWVPGYAQAGLFFGYGLEEVEKEIDKIYENNIERYEDLQGTCYPLFSPGTEFWTAEGENQCNELGSRTEETLFETVLLFEGRKKFAEKSTKRASQVCIDNCWAIPGYGSSDGKNYLKVEDLMTWQLGTENIPNADISYLSRREGYYCLTGSGKSDILDNWKAGLELVDEIKCAVHGSDEDLKRRRVKQFYTHEQWLKAISERARSIGDCGYKPHAYSEDTGWEGDPDSERIVVNFEGLTQDLETVERLIGERKLIYRGSDIDAGVPIAGSGYRDT